MMKDTIRGCRRLKMGSIILTGIRHGDHQFSLDYPVVDGKMICMAHCECGYEVEIPNFNSYSGGMYLQWVWEKHIGSGRDGFKSKT